MEKMDTLFRWHAEHMNSLRHIRVKYRTCDDIRRYAGRGLRGELKVYTGKMAEDAFNICKRNGIEIELFDLIRMFSRDSICLVSPKFISIMAENGFHFDEV